MTSKRREQERGVGAGRLRRVWAGHTKSETADASRTREFFSRDAKRLLKGGGSLRLAHSRSKPRRRGGKSRRQSGRTSGCDRFPAAFSPRSRISPSVIGVSARRRECAGEQFQHERPIEVHGRIGSRFGHSASLIADISFGDVQRLGRGNNGSRTASKGVRRSPSEPGSKVWISSAQPCSANSRSSSGTRTTVPCPRAATATDLPTTGQ